MKKNKIILSSAALLITIVGNLAFKVAKKFGTRLAFVQYINGCHECIGLWTSYFPEANKCRTHLNGAQHLGAGPGNFTFYTTQDPTDLMVCIHPTYASFMQ